MVKKIILFSFFIKSLYIYIYNLEITFYHNLSIYVCVSKKKKSIYIRVKLIYGDVISGSCFPYSTSTYIQGRGYSWTRGQ